MTDDEQIAICKRVAVLGMWGHGWMGSTLTEDLDRYGPSGPRSWTQVYRENHKQAIRDHIGVITDEAELQRYLGQRYWLANFDEDGCSLFNPPPMNGLCKYVSKELTDARRNRRFA